METNTKLPYDVDDNRPYTAVVFASGDDNGGTKMSALTWHGEISGNLSMAAADLGDVGVGIAHGGYASAAVAWSFSEAGGLVVSPLALTVELAVDLGSVAFDGTASILLPCNAGSVGIVDGTIFIATKVGVCPLTLVST